jgi:hypothetical protein
VDRILAVVEKGAFVEEGGGVSVMTNGDPGTGTYK